MSIDPDACNAHVPRIATAMARIHIRIRCQSPKLTISVIAPIVQKRTRCATAPSTNASVKARPTTSVARCDGSCISERGTIEDRALYDPPTLAASLLRCPPGGAIRAWDGPARSCDRILDAQTLEAREIPVGRHQDRIVT